MFQPQISPTLILTWKNSSCYLEKKSHYYLKSLLSEPLLSDDDKSTSHYDPRAMIQWTSGECDSVHEKEALTKRIPGQPVKGGKSDGLEARIPSRQTQERKEKGI